MAKKLTPKQDRFCHEYMVDCNATQAAIRAEYSKKTAGKIASHLVVKSSVKQRIKELREKQENRLDYGSDDVVNGFIDVARRAKIAKDLGNENRALENLGKHLGIFEHDNKQRAAAPPTLVIHQPKPKEDKKQPVVAQLDLDCR